MNAKLLRTAKNIDVAVRFLGEKIDELDEVLEKLDGNCEMKDEVVELDRLTSDFNELYELFYNLSQELNEAKDKFDIENVFKRLSISLCLLQDTSNNLEDLTKIIELYCNEKAENLNEISFKIYSLYEFMNLQLEVLERIISNQ